MTTYRLSIPCFLAPMQEQPPPKELEARLDFVVEANSPGEAAARFRKSLALAIVLCGNLEQAFPQETGK